MDRIIMDHANILVDIKKIYKSSDDSGLSSGGDVYSSFPTLLLCLVSPVTVSLPFLLPSPASPAQPSQPSPAQPSPAQPSPAQPSLVHIR